MEALKATDQAETIELGEISTTLGFLLRVAQIQTFDRFYETLGDYGLKPGEFTVLWVLSLNPGLRQGAVARNLSIKPAHMTKLVGRLVKRGLVSKTTEPGDRRAVRLSLTEKGQTFVDENRDAFLQQNALEKNQLSSEEMTKLIGLLQKLTGMDAHAS